jgi:hypothetical protein
MTGLKLPRNPVLIAPVLGCPVDDRPSTPGKVRTDQHVERPDPNHLEVPDPELFVLVDVSKDLFEGRSGFRIGIEKFEDFLLPVVRNDVFLTVSVGNPHGSLRERQFLIVGINEPIAHDHTSYVFKQPNRNATGRLSSNPSDEPPDRAKDYTV